MDFVVCVWVGVCIAWGLAELCACVDLSCMWDCACVAVCVFCAYFRCVYVAEILCGLCEGELICVLL